MAIQAVIPITVGALAFKGAQSAYDSIWGMGDGDIIGRSDKTAPNNAGEPPTAILSATGELLNQPAQLVGNATRAIIEPVGGGLVARGVGAVVKFGVLAAAAYGVYMWARK